MKTTRQVIRILAAANPQHAPTEERIRHALRRGAVSPPPLFAGRLAWRREDIIVLADVLGLVCPSKDQG